MSVEYQVLFNLAIGAAAFFGGWMVNRLTITIDRLDQDIRNLPMHYVSKDDYRTDMAEIKSSLKDIFDLLRHKVDK
jgi:hypothetical protein